MHVRKPQREVNIRVFDPIQILFHFNEIVTVFLLGFHNQMT